MTTSRRTTRLLPPGIAVATLALAACSSGFGLQQAENTYARACEHQKAYLAAVDRGDQDAARAAVQRLREDAERERSPDVRKQFAEIAAAAEDGDPGPARRNVELNC